MVEKDVKPVQFLKSSSQNSNWTSENKISIGMSLKKAINFNESGEYGNQFFELDPFTGSACKHGIGF